MNAPVFAHGQMRLYLLMLLADSPKHGYELMTAIEQRFNGTYVPSAGTIYPRLAKLTEEGLVDKRTVGRKTVYAITDAGRAELKARRGETERVERTIDTSVRRLADDLRADMRRSMGGLKDDMSATERDYVHAAKAARRSAKMGGGAMRAAKRDDRRMADMTTIAIIGAMDEEVALIAEALDDVTRTEEASLTVTRGTLGTADGGRATVVATVGGMGLVNAAATTQYLIDACHPDAVIFSGIAGNLNKAMHVNDVVLGGTLRYLDTDMRLVGQWKPGTPDHQVEEFHSDAHLLDVADAVLDGMGITHMTGTIASGNYFVDSPEQVAKVKETTGADAVEMEGAAVAHVAARNDVPALVIRALSDNADTDYEVFREFDISEYADTAARLAVGIVSRL